MQLLHKLLGSAARYNFSITAQYLPGLSNSIANALSRFNWQAFWRLAAQARLEPVAIPQTILEDLIPPS